MSQNLERLKKLLAEIFQLDQAELDFGIYRIMNAKRDEITRFLDNDLLPQVRAVLSTYERESRASLEAELEKAKEQAKDLGFEDPAQAPKVKELQARYNAAFDVEAAEQEVFSHLYNFFRRYYSEGDFISQRRYKEGVYAIPYEGEEVKLHWANHDQYYIKTSEYLRNYTFKLPSGERVHFKLVEADTEKDNNRPPNGNERRFLLGRSEGATEGQGDIWDPADDELVIYFRYVPDPHKRKQADLNAEACERLTSLIMQSPLLRVAWSPLLEKRPTEKNANRTLLEKHLSDYTARNTFDYFIHKDLGGFLRRELDFYIKNEVMHLDDVENETAPRVEQYLSKIKVIRRIAHKIIDFLAQLEDFQKKLWLKKKFVVETSYCIRLGVIPEEFYPEIAANDAQREEWVRLCAIDEITGDLTRPGYSEPLSIDFLKTHPTLVVDTRHFSINFCNRLLDAIENLPENIDGILFHGDNFHALSTINKQCAGRLTCIYIDPPYNTDAGPIDYKNGYRSSSWMSMIHSRLELARTLVNEHGVLCVTIDDYQLHELALLLNDYYGKENSLGTAVIRNNASGRPSVTGLSVCHEYALFYSNGKASVNKLPRTEEQLQRFSKEGDEYVNWQPFLKGGGAVTYRSARPKQFYPIYVNTESKSLRIPKLSWNRERREWQTAEQPNPDEVVVWPIDEKGNERIWSLNHTTAQDNIKNLEVRISKDGSPKVFRKHTPADGVVPRTWWDKTTYGAREYGTAILSDLFGSSPFSFAKSPFAVEDCLRVAGLASETDGEVLDYFAGSGTTGHAVINLNREDGGRRKFILVEMAEYFDSVLVPRLKKVIYTPEWKDGKPKRLPTAEEIERSPRIMKILRLESYEDTLNNLELRRTEAQEELLFPSSPSASSAVKDFREDYMLRYMLDVESRGSASLLNVDRFEDPFNYTLNIATGTAGETKPTVVDLVETFNYLIGLRVKTMDDVRGVRVVTGFLRQGDGATGGQGERVLILWRNTKEINNDALDAWFRKQGYNTKDQEYDVIYVNGDNNLENLRKADQTWKVRLIEEEFKRLMFDVNDV